ncbi:MAG: dihydropteroate synthase [Spirochaetia bacterium]|nr:dihydropteroate synthase [Spirochaetia bacterium]
MELEARDKKLRNDGCILMGIINITPDSFSDAGRFFNPAAAVSGALQQIKDGAVIVDIGGESTRPGSARITADEEKKRVIPVIEALRMADSGIIISVDTYKPQTAAAALDAGADIVNDITAGTLDPVIMDIAASYNAGYVIMHMQGTPESMQVSPSYSDKGVVEDIKSFFGARIEAAKKAGIREQNLILDPGIGFGKTLKDNYLILAGLREFRMFGLPLLLGVSNKSLIGSVTGAPVQNRLSGTAAAVALCAMNGADIVRVHDVAEMGQVLKVVEAFKNRDKPEG